MSILRPSAKILPYVLLAAFGILYIYDAGLEKEGVLPEIVSGTLFIPEPSTSNVLTKKIHIVKDGENLSLIFEKYKVPLNDTYKIFRKDNTNQVKNILPDDRLEFISVDEKLQKIIIYKGPLLSYQIDLSSEIIIERIDKKPELINSF